MKKKFECSIINLNKQSNQKKIIFDFLFVNSSKIYDLVNLDPFITHGCCNISNIEILVSYGDNILLIKSLKVSGKNLMSFYISFSRS